MEKNTTLLDIYVASGGELTEDGTAVRLAERMQPFDIKLRVVPIEIRTGYDEPETVKFAIYLHDEIAVDGGYLNHFEFDETVTLPVSQVDIVKDES